ncbi:MAG TPA: lysophospholipid acyltransferase family protein [Rhodanobacteraceae bacterium]|nr:lysophospholipid acyltransferase family protein [Rhodanobacteraceae bacterium]
MRAIPRPAELPSKMPHAADHLGRWLCRGLLRLGRWRLVGEFPDVARLVMIAAPHSSWWDGIWGLLIKVAIGADIRFMGKQELFHGPLGWVLRQLGGLPIDRAAAQGVVEQMVDTFTRHDALWLGLAPEGTRKPVTRWKSGFWHIARAADVPIFPIAFNYPDRSIRLGPLFKTSADMDADITRLRQWYAPFQGKHRGV